MEERNNVSWMQLARDFLHNTLFSFAVGPFINGMSSAINHQGFWNGVKEVATSWRGWKCNAELALAIGIIATAVNGLLGRHTTQTTTQQLAPSPAQEEAQVNLGHAAREQERREYSVLNASKSR